MSGFFNYLKLTFFGPFYVRKQWRELIKKGHENYDLIPSEKDEVPEEILQKIYSYDYKGLQQSYKVSETQFKIITDEEAISISKEMREKMLLSFKKEYGPATGFFSNLVVRRGLCNGHPDIVFISQCDFTNAHFLNIYDLDEVRPSRDSYTVYLRAITYKVGIGIGNKIRTLAYSFACLFGLFLLIASALHEGHSVIAYVFFGCVLFSPIAYMLYDRKISPHQLEAANPETETEPFIVEDLLKMKKLFREASRIGNQKENDYVPQVRHIRAAGCAPKS